MPFNKVTVSLMLRKCNHIEIYMLTPQGLQLMLEVPLYGTLATLELFRSRSETQDFLFIGMERYRYCVLQWDGGKSELLTRSEGDVSEFFGRPTDNGQIGIIDRRYRLIGLHLYDGLFKVIPFDNKGHLKEALNIRLEELVVLDIKFLYRCENPTVVVLYQDNNDARHIKTYEIALEDKKFVEGSWSQNNLDNCARLLIPVPLGGVIIVGEDTIVYCSSTTIKSLSIKQSIIRAVELVDPYGSRYLYGDSTGALHFLVITHESGRVTGLKSRFIGETSIASTISYLGSGFVYIGSQFGDSQLLKLNTQADASGSFVKILEQYMNIGPIVDLCVVDFERQGQGQVITCSGAYKDGSIRAIRNELVITDQASLQLHGMKGLWSLKCSSNDPYDTFLVVTFINKTRFLAINKENELVETPIEGFVSETQTLVCGTAIHNQLIQVTAQSVRLVSSTSRDLLDQWFAPTGFPVNVAAANACQVLLATGGFHLIYLEITSSKLVEVKHVELEHAISCLDINPIGESPQHSSLAAVGMWTDTSVRIFSLPGLELIRKENLGEAVPRSVLLCTIEEVSYLFCALGDGHLFSFVFNISTCELSDRSRVCLGTQPISLYKYSSHNRTRVFAASDRPTIIYSRDKKLLYSYVNLKEMNHVCSFNTVIFPESIAIAKEAELSIGAITDFRKPHIHTIPLNEHARRICHQERSQTLALCSFKNKDMHAVSETHFVRLLDHQTFGFLSTHTLDSFECGCSIISCSFSGDDNFYYCVGTAYVLPMEDEPTKGRILVFLVEEGKLQLITAKETKGAVYSLKAFNGKLLAAINQKIRLYKWVQRDDRSHVLQFECAHDGRVLSLYTQTRGDFILVGDMMRSLSLLMYKHEEGEIEEVARDLNTNWMTAVEMLDDDIFIGADKCCNLFTVFKSPYGWLEPVGEYHLGDVVNRLHHGSLVMHHTDSETGQFPTVIFGTVNGAIGVIASLPSDLYVFLEKLQSVLANFVKGVGNLSHAEWRSFHNARRISYARNFVDGDLIESFLSLSPSHMVEVAWAMGVPAVDLYKKVQELTKLH
ncbi:DNA damage-binding protein 1-like isoform X2 [Hordeum vulgare subsp. vulgare]|uniref:DNA damage-binding protein 1-like isoform X2 n=1 Tax=Hordeum vulgare subsp. vulgare TaxID=112509 RepID=UPI001D1A566B|nr:DNA damage-binding protein 1-like isoform X2 [Hordeum vulgare subsp. vulgare]